MHLPDYSPFHFFHRLAGFGRPAVFVPAVVLILRWRRLGLLNLHVLVSLPELLTWECLPFNATE